MARRRQQGAVDLDDRVGEQGLDAIRFEIERCGDLGDEASWIRCIQNTSRASGGMASSAAR
jgi:hypothetical protein